MKTAEEWMSQMSGLNNPALLTVNRMAIREIQLDAMKEGMRRAEMLVQKEHNSFSEPNCNGAFKTARNRMSNAILTAEQLTEKDL